MPQNFDGLGRYDGPRKTFTSSFQLVAATNATAFVTLTAAATGTTRSLRLKKVRIGNATLTAAAAIRIGLRKYSTQPTGGTSTNPAIASLRTGEGAPTAVINAYTVAPSGGLATPVTISEYNIGALATAATTVSNEIVEDFDSDRVELPAVVGSAECIGLAFLASPASAVTMTISLTWTEDNA